MVILRGKSVYRGICSGKLVFVRKKGVQVTRYQVQDREKELTRFEEAKRKAVLQLRRLYKNMKKSVGSGNAAIFEMHEMLLEDVEYCGSIRSLIMDQNVNLEYAIQETKDSLCGMLESVEDECMRERAVDIADISKRLLDILTGADPVIQKLQMPCIIAAEDLMPSETIQLPRDMVLGICLQRGSLTSHTAILARSMGIPALVDVGSALTSEYDGSEVILDGYAGRIYVDPDEEMRQNLLEKREQSEGQRAMLRRLWGKENITQDGKRIRLYANVGSLDDLETVTANDAGGIGLYRSEFLFLDRDSAPTEEEQFQIYKTIMKRMEGREVIIRTMDIGADKQVEYLGMPHEDNPALGCRAIRMCLERRELLKTQLRALYRAGLYGCLLIMYPMIAAVEEVLALREIEDEVKNELRWADTPFRERLPRGIMIETPSAALISDELAPLVDFFSIGTNDLTQYTMAADRQNPQMEHLNSGCHRAVMKLVRIAVENAHRAGIWAGICGELAADTSLTEEFVRMGIDELSVAPGLLLPVRQRIREIDLRD